MTLCYKGLSYRATCSRCFSDFAINLGLWCVTSKRCNYKLNWNLKINLINISCGGTWRAREPDVFQIDHVVFGVNSSTFEAQFVAEEDARRPQSDVPLAGEAIFKSRYMDDSVDCVPDVKTGVELISQLWQLWGFAEINVRKWLSNEPERICNLFVICLPHEAVRSSYELV